MRGSFLVSWNPATVWSVWENVLVTPAHTPRLCFQTCLPQEAEYSSCYQNPQRDFITCSSTDYKSQRDTILCIWQWISHLRLLMCKDVYLEGKALLQRIKEKRFFLERNIYQEFGTNGVTWGFVPGDGVSWRTMETVAGLFDCPSPLAQGSPIQIASNMLRRWWWKQSVTSHLSGLMRLSWAPFLNSELCRCCWSAC